MVAEGDVQPVRGCAELDQQNIKNKQKHNCQQPGH